MHSVDPAERLDEGGTHPVAGVDRQCARCLGVTDDQSIHEFHEHQRTVTDFAGLRDSEDSRYWYVGVRQGGQNPSLPHHIVRRVRHRTRGRAAKDPPVTFGIGKCVGEVGLPGAKASDIQGWTEVRHTGRQPAAQLGWLDPGHGGGGPRLGGAHRIAPPSITRT
ncbi:hypothetical protein MSAS_28020 [Mycobacterium saskatchewanense]|nr:hypothetical protein MSAS_28020 [Mycobacterium saskatchewanense]